MEKIKDKKSLSRKGAEAQRKDKRKIKRQRKKGKVFREGAKKR